MLLIPSALFLKGSGHQRRETEAEGDYLGLRGVPVSSALGKGWMDGVSLARRGQGTSWGGRAPRPPGGAQAPVASLEIPLQSLV